MFISWNGKCEWKNGNETHVYVAKYNLGMGIKCVGPTQFGNKKWESNSHEGWDKNEEMGMEYMFTFISL